MSFAPPMSRVRCDTVPVSKSMFLPLLCTNTTAPSNTSLPGPSTCILPSTIERTYMISFDLACMNLFDLWLCGKWLRVYALHYSLTNRTAALIAGAVTMVTAIETHAHHHAALTSVTRMHQKWWSLQHIVWTHTRTLLVNWKSMKSFEF